ncbi:MAG: GDSL-type esterase/lipase family protein [Clostridiales Family XIII bacterium]|jgi:lysophospholipase L1-like esterase|nr:GDSL-type esterase/lipase family protein [Clostridiales Family XIII bacterium]
MKKKMKKILTFALAVIMVFTIQGVTFSSFAATDDDSDKVRIMALGDSLVVGTGSTSSTDLAGFRSPLQKALKAAGVDFDFVGSVSIGNRNRIDADSEGHLLYRIDQIASNAKKWVKAADPDIVLLLTGLQDITINYKLSTVADRYEGLLNTIRETAPGVQIVVATMIDQPTSTLQRRTTDFNNDLRDLVDQQAAEYGDVVLAELGGLLLLSEYLVSVPNDKGYIRIAGVFAEALTGLLPYGDMDKLTAPPLKILSLGSSETVGVGSGNRSDFAGYRGYLQEILDEASLYYDFLGSQQMGDPTHIDIDHEGHNGWRIDQIASSIKSLLASKPDVVLLQIGSNDCWQKYKLDQAAEKYDKLINDIRAYAAPGVKIVISTVLESTDDEQAARVRTLNESIREIAAAQAAEFGDVYLAELETALDRGTDYADTLHPDDSGYVKMASVYANVLSEFIDGVQGELVDPPIRILPFGDSVTLGLGSGLDSGLAGFRGYLYNRLNNSGLSVDFVGSLYTGLPSYVDPDHEGHLSLRIDQLAASAEKWVGKSTPDVILLYAGTADLTLNYKLSTAPARFEDLLDKVHAAAPDAKIIVSTVIDPSVKLIYQARVDSFNKELRKIVTKKQTEYGNVWLADMSGALKPLVDHFSILVPKDSGYSKMANIWKDAVLEALEAVGE